MLTWPCLVPQAEGVLLACLYHKNTQNCIIMGNTPSILITGGAGYIGSHTAWLLSEEFNLVLLDNLSSGANTPTPPQAEFVKGDVDNEPTLEGIFTKHSIQAVIHLAASLVAPESVQKPLLYYQNNFCSTLTLLQSCLKHRVPNLLFASTSAVYTSHIQLPAKEENTSHKPPNPYGHSKLMVENMLQDAYIAGGLNFIALRYFNVSGADPKGRTGNCNSKNFTLMKLISQIALGKKEYLPLCNTGSETPDGSAIRDYVHVWDVAKANQLAIKMLLNNQIKPDTPRIFNCGSGQGSSVKEIVRATEKITKKPLPTKEAPLRKGDIPSVIADISLIKDVLGWQPSLSTLPLMVEHTLNWEQKLN